MEENKKSLLDSGREFMALNWYILWVVILGVFLYIAIVIGDLSEKYSVALEKIDKATKGIVLLDYTGRVIQVDKRTIDSTNTAFQAAVKNALRFYLIQDWQTLSKNYSVKIKSTDDIETNNPDIVEFRDNYLAHGKQAGSDYLAFIKTLAYLIGSDNLPEKIKASDTTVVSYNVDQNTFDIELRVNVSQSVYLIESDRTVDKTGTIEIKATGEFDPSDGTPVNPLGIRFTSIQPTYLKKR